MKCLPKRCLFCLQSINSLPIERTFKITSNIHPTVKASIGDSTFLFIFSGKSRMSTIKIFSYLAHRAVSCLSWREKAYVWVSHGVHKSCKCNRLIGKRVHCTVILIYSWRHCDHKEWVFQNVSISFLFIKK